MPNLGYRGDWVPWVIWCFAKKLCTRCDAWVGALSWWSCQSPVTHSCSLLNHPNSFRGGMFKLNTKLDADLSLYLLSHFECNSHTVHILNSVYYPQFSLFMHVYSSPFSLAARLHPCCANCPCYINNGWTFSGLVYPDIRQTLNKRQLFICPIPQKRFFGQHKYVCFLEI